MRFVRKPDRSLLLSGFFRGLAQLYFSQTAQPYSLMHSQNRIGNRIGNKHNGFKFGGHCRIYARRCYDNLFGWRSIFLINVPIGIAGTLWGYMRLKERVIKPNKSEI